MTMAIKMKNAGFEPGVQRKGDLQAYGEWKERVGKPMQIDQKRQPSREPPGGVITKTSSAETTKVELYPDWEKFLRTENGRQVGIDKMNRTIDTLEKQYGQSVDWESSDYKKLTVRANS